MTPGKTDEAIVLSAAKTSCAYDNLRPTMRLAFYSVTHAGRAVTHLAGGPSAISGYEGWQDQPDHLPTTFKGLAVICDPSVPTDEIRFMRGSEIVAVIRNIS